MIAVVGTIVIGPEKLPGALRQLVEWKRKLTQMTQGLSAEVSEQLRVHELHQDLKKAEEQGLENIAPNLQRSIDELKAAAASVNVLPDMNPPATNSHNSKQDNAKQAIEPLLKNSENEQVKKSNES